MIELTITSNKGTKDSPLKENEIHILDIDKIVNCSVDVMHLEDLLDYTNDRQHVLQLLIKKLRLNGELDINGTDLFDMIRAITIAEISMEEINQLLYQGKKSVDSLIGVIELLQDNGLQILIKQICPKYQYYIRAKRCNKKE